MPSDLEPRRVLITAEAVSSGPLLALFERGRVGGWSALEANSFEQARFTLHHQYCDAVLVCVNGYPHEADGLAWLARQGEPVVLLLSRTEPAIMTQALEQGVGQCLPYELAVGHPPLLAAALNQAMQLGELRRRLRQSGAGLKESQRQVERLVNLLWRTLPSDSQPRWFTQRYMMERLHEEVGRAGRYGDPLSVVLGEVETIPGADNAELNGWAANRLLKAKRVCDVAGHYGPHGFLLLLVQTAEAGALACCRRLQQILGQPAGAAEGLSSIRISFGVASYSATASTSRRLLSLAEQQLETAREASASLEAAV